MKFFEGRFLSACNIFVSDYFNLLFFLLSYRILDVFVGSSILSRNDSNSLFKSVLLFLNILGLTAVNLHVVMSHIGHLSLFESGILCNINYSKYLINVFNDSFLYLCGANIDHFNDSMLKKSRFVVFQGSFFSQRLYDVVDLILPSTVYTEGIFYYLILRVVVELLSVLFLGI